MKNNGLTKMPGAVLALSSLALAFFAPAAAGDGLDDSPWGACLRAASAVMLSPGCSDRNRETGKARGGIQWAHGLRSDVGHSDVGHTVVKALASAAALGTTKILNQPGQRYSSLGRAASGPLTGVVSLPLDGLVLRASVSTSPEAQALFSPLAVWDLQPRVVGGSSLRSPGFALAPASERTLSYSGGIALSPGAGLTLSVNFFHNLYEDVVVGENPNPSAVFGTVLPGAAFSGLLMSQTVESVDPDGVPGVAVEPGVSGVDLSGVGTGNGTWEEGLMILGMLGGGSADLPARGTPLTSHFPSGGPLDPVSWGGEVDGLDQRLSHLGASEITVSGLELNLGYQFEVGDLDAFALGFSLIRLVQYGSSDLEGNFSDVLDRREASAILKHVVPETRAFLDFYWSRGNGLLAASLNYASDCGDHCHHLASRTVAFDVEKGHESEISFGLDISYSLFLPQGFQNGEWRPPAKITFGVKNLLAGASPAAQLLGGGHDFSHGNLHSRIWYLRGDLSF